MVTQAEKSNNGHKPFAPDAFNPGSALKPGHSVGDAYKLIETQDKVRDFLMKSKVQNSDKAIQAAMALYYCEHNGLDDEKNLVLNALALFCSIEAERARMLLQGIIGVLENEKPRQQSNFWGKRSAESNNKE